MQSIEEIEILFEETRKLIALYESYKRPIPFGLKGNLGEFHVQRKLLEMSPDIKPNLLGGSRPSLDIDWDGVRIQVKTQVKLPRMEFKGGWFDYESSPTVKKAILDDDKVDVLALVILYPTNGFEKIEKIRSYIFDQSEFCHFKTEFCWSGKSKGDKTIVNVLGFEGIPPRKLKETIETYNTLDYRRLFESSLENWQKIQWAHTRSRG